MFSFFKKSSAPDYGLFERLGVDMHAHLLPGIDDGAPDTTAALNLIRQLQELGYRRFYTTPHIYKEYYPNTQESIQGALHTLHGALQEAGMQAEVHAAAEYFLDEHFEDLLSRGALLELPGRHVLIEMSFYAPYPNLHHTVFKMCTSGYKPILAHPERYLYYAQDFEQFEMIRNYGCKLQVNISSFAGYYGKLSQKLAYKLLEQDLIDFLGTDVHHQKHIDALRNLAADGSLIKKLERIEFQNTIWL
jgi:protein-tyrosine phosphatase